MEKQRKSIVAIGGGTGTHTVLSGLKKHTKKLNISAIVAMTDSGGSTGRLRDEFGYLPVGDVRMALAALAREDDEHEELIRQLFLHRFEKGNGLSGHNFGNLFLVALTDVLGSEEEAILAASKVLRVCGRVVPVTNQQVHLVAQYDDGVVITGEHEIDEPEEERNGHRIVDLRLSGSATIHPDAKDVIENANLIVLGPGDLYTSLLTNCIVDGMAEAIVKSKAKFVYISNLMTKLGQTVGMGTADHVHEVAKYVGRMPDVVLINTASLREDLLKRYESEHEYPVKDDLDSKKIKIIRTDLVANEEVVTSSGDVLKRSLIRHDSDKLACAIMELLAHENNS